LTGRMLIWYKLYSKACARREPALSEKIRSKLAEALCKSERVAEVSKGCICPFLVSQRAHFLLSFNKGGVSVYHAR